MTSNQQPEAKKPFFDNKRLAFTATILIVVALAVAVLSYGSLTNNTTNDNLQNTADDSAQPSATSQIQSPTSWMTKGAYAVYEGQAEILSISLDFNARMEVVDLNSTHVEISTSFDMDSSFGSSENTTSMWVSRDEMNFQPEGLNLNSSYTTQITLPNLGTRNCIVYQYSDQDFSATYYVDSTLQWPLKMVMTSPTSDDGQSYSMDVNLVDSNIPGLYPSFLFCLVCCLIISMIVRVSILTESFWLLNGVVAAYSAETNLCFYVSFTLRTLSSLFLRVCFCWGTVPTSEKFIVEHLFFIVEFDLVFFKVGLFLF